MIALGASLVSVAASFLAGQALIAATARPTDALSNPETMRALPCAIAYLSLTAMLGLAFGVFTRSISGALAILVAVQLLVPALGHTMSRTAAEAIAAYWPISAGQTAYHIVGLTPIPPLLGIGILTLCTIYVTVASHLVIRHRDI